MGSICDRLSGFVCTHRYKNTAKVALFDQTKTGGDELLSNFFLPHSVCPAAECMFGTIFYLSFLLRREKKVVGKK